MIFYYHEDCAISTEITIPALITITVTITSAANAISTIITSNYLACPNCSLLPLLLLLISTPTDALSENINFFFLFQFTQEKKETVLRLLFIAKTFSAVFITFPSLSLSLSLTVFTTSEFFLTFSLTVKYVLFLKKYVLSCLLRSG